MILSLFAVTLFLNAVLLFWIEPMFAKMVLPVLGGSPTVWTLCMVFYQVTLLLGYAYAHFISVRLKAIHQVLLHGVLLLSSLVIVPLLLLKDFSAEKISRPVPWLLLTLTASIGLPFFAVSANGSLLQKWFSKTKHRLSSDPYFLYKWSNLGSVLGLLSYPLFLEVHFTLRIQNVGWMISYIAMAILTLSCGAILWKSKTRQQAASGQESGIEPSHFTHDPAGRPTRRQRLIWIVLAFVPSSFMLGVTNHITLDISPIPLLWVLPLTLYLITFVFVFSKSPLIPNEWMVRGMPILLVPLSLLLLTQATHPAWLIFPFHLVSLFVVAMMCHGRLADSRPTVRYLTEFYFFLSLGGALGGIFNGLLAPFLFNSIAEYPIAIILASFLKPLTDESEDSATRRRLDVGLPLGLGLLTAGLLIGIQKGGLMPQGLSLRLLFVLPTILCFTFSNRPVRFGLGLAVLFLCNGTLIHETGKRLYSERSFFGVSRVINDEKGKIHWLTHGNTIHGGQHRDPARAHEPLAYFHPSGPLGHIFKIFNETHATANVAVVGLGTGSMIAYAEFGQKWTFFELDPTVVAIAKNPAYFTFLDRSPIIPKIILGDARLSLTETATKPYDMILIDAFGSDAIPVHLLTQEAMRLYMDKLTQDGLLVFHISNRYLDLKLILGDLAEALQLTALVNENLAVPREDIEMGIWPSRWLVMAKNPDALKNLTKDPHWKSLRGRPTKAVWTDDYSNVLSVFRWSE